MFNILLQLHYLGCAIARVVSRRLFTMEAQVYAQGNSYEICGGQSVTGAGFSLEFFSFAPSVSF
jgi:hypothetical protein